LHGLAEQLTGFLIQHVIHHGQCSFRALIGVPPRLLYPELMASLGRFSAHVDEVSPFCNIASTMHDAVILFIVHDVKSHTVLKRENCCAPLKVSKTSQRKN
jgi:hypothetical protein